MTRATLLKCPITHSRICVRQTQFYVLPPDCFVHNQVISWQILHKLRRIIEMIFSMSHICISKHWWCFPAPQNPSFVPFLMLFYIIQGQSPPMTWVISWRMITVLAVIAATPTTLLTLLTLVTVHTTAVPVPGEHSVPTWTWPRRWSWYWGRSGDETWIMEIGSLTEE